LLQNGILDFVSRFSQLSGIANIKIYVDAKPTRLSTNLMESIPLGIR